MLFTILKSIYVAIADTLFSAFLLTQPDETLEAKFEINVISTL